MLVLGGGEGVEEGGGDRVVSIVHRVLFQLLTGMIKEVRRCLGRGYFTILEIYSKGIKSLFSFVDC